MAQAVEIVRFTVLPEHVEVFLAGRAAAIDAVRAAFPGLEQAFLTQVGDEEWIDLVVWSSRAQAEAAAEGVMALPPFAEWCRSIAKVRGVEHADVRAMNA